MDIARHQAHIDGLYEWITALCAGEARNDETAISRWWTDDARIVTNGETVVTGTQQLKAHFDGFVEAYAWLRYLRPCVEYGECGDLVTMEYVCQAESKPGRTPVVGDTGSLVHRYHVMALFKMRSSRIAEMREVAVCFPGLS